MPLLLEGFEQSWAAVFFITPNFQDKNYLATEVDYAIAQKSKKRDWFSIIPIVISDENQKGKVPNLLERFAWKEPKNELDALDEIVRALPLAPENQVGRSVSVSLPILINQCGIWVYEHLYDNACRDDIDTDQWFPPDLRWNAYVRILFSCGLPRVFFRLAKKQSQIADLHIIQPNRGVRTK